MQAEHEPLAGDMARQLAQGRFILTRDGLGVADALASTLRSRGRDVAIVESAQLEVEDGLVEHCRLLAAGPSIGGLVHLAPLGAPALADSATVADWRAALQVNEKSFFVLARELLGRLVEGAHVVAASDLGGLFGRGATASDLLRVESGAVGALKSLAEERADLRVKAVDLDPTRSAADLARRMAGGRPKRR